jgi:hypothetical protein
MAFAIDTVSQLLAWLRHEPVVSAALTMLLLGPGAVCCWLAHHVAGVRVVQAGPHPFGARRRHTDRLEARVASLVTALTLLTDSTESALKEAFTGLERLSGAMALAPETRVAAPQRLKAAAAQGRTPRDIAIAEGLSEAEVRLRLRLQGVELAEA